MDQLAMLWHYQVEDRKADKLEQELSRSPLRQKMNTCRTQFNAKQKQYKQMEEQVAILSDRKDAIRDAITRCEEQLRHLQSRFEQNPPTELDDTKALLSEVNRFLETIGSYEQEMKRMAKDANDYDQKERSLRRDAIKLKEEFDNLKKQYDKDSSRTDRETSGSSFSREDSYEKNNPVCFSSSINISNRGTCRISNVTVGVGSGICAYRCPIQPGSKRIPISHTTIDLINDLILFLRSGNQTCVQCLVNNLQDILQRQIIKSSGQSRSLILCLVRNLDLIIITQVLNHLIQRCLHKTKLPCPPS